MGTTEEQTASFLRKLKVSYLDCCQQPKLATIATASAANTRSSARTAQPSLFNRCRYRTKESRFPFAAFSVKKYTRESTGAICFRSFFQRLFSFLLSLTVIQRISSLFRAEKHQTHIPAESYQYLLDGLKKRDASCKALYDPLFLDNPEVRFGRHSAVLSLPSLVSSISPFTRQETLKRQLNERFSRSHEGQVPMNITLSKIRSLKAKIAEVSLQAALELSTAGIAIAYLERLVLRRYLQKENRKLTACACLLLAAKVNDRKIGPSDLFFTECERVLGCTRIEILYSELQVFVALDFDLHMQPDAYLPHFERIVNGLDFFSNIQQYLGETSFHLWRSSV